MKLLVLGLILFSKNSYSEDILQNLEINNNIFFYLNIDYHLMYNIIFILLAISLLTYTIYRTINNEDIISANDNLKKINPALHNYINKKND